MSKSVLNIPCPRLLNYRIKESYMIINIYQALLSEMAGCPRGVMVKAMDCGIEVSEFVLQSRYYFHFRTNTIRKDMNPLILPAMG